MKKIFLGLTKSEFVIPIEAKLFGLIQSARNPLILTQNMHLSSEAYSGFMTYIELQIDRAKKDRKIEIYSWDKLTEASKHLNVEIDTKPLQPPPVICEAINPEISEGLQLGNSVEPEETIHEVILGDLKEAALSFQRTAKNDLSKLENLQSVLHGNLAQTDTENRKLATLTKKRTTLTVAKLVIMLISSLAILFSLVPFIILTR